MDLLNFGPKGSKMGPPGLSEDKMKSHFKALVSLFPPASFPIARTRQVSKLWIFGSMEVPNFVFLDSWNFVVLEVWNFGVFEILILLFDLQLGNPRIKNPKFQTSQNPKLQSSNLPKVPSSQISEILKSKVREIHIIPCLPNLERHIHSLDFWDFGSFRIWIFGFLVF